MVLRMLMIIFTGLCDCFISQMWSRAENDDVKTHHFQIWTEQKAQKLR